jgi:hypothetical protein
MLGYILLILGLAFIAIGVAYIALRGRQDGKAEPSQDKIKGSSNRQGDGPDNRQPAKGQPVTLDRNPELPPNLKMPGSTS